MIDRVDKRLVFKRLNDQPGQSNPGRAAQRWVGTAHPKAGTLRSIPPSACSKDCSITNEQGANRRRSRRLARGPKTICSSAACSARFEPAKSSTNLLRFSFTTFWHYNVLRGLDYLRNAGIKPDSRVREAIEIMIECRHQNGRWPLNLLHPEHIWRWRPVSAGRAAGTHCALSEFCVGTTIQGGSCDWAARAMAWVGKSLRICHSDRIPTEVIYPRVT